MSIGDILDGLATNPYLGASFGLLSLGASAAFLKNRNAGAVIHFQKHLMEKLKAPFREKSYQRLLEWITEKGPKKTKWESGKIQKECEIIKEKCELTPIIRTNEERYKYMGLPLKNVTLAAFERDRNMYINILEKARQLALEANEKKETYLAGEAKRSLFSHSQILPANESIGEDKTADMFRVRKDFITYPRWCITPRSPNREGCLFYGLPDCEKSSLIRALFEDLDYGIYLWNLSGQIITDDLLNYLQNDALVLDDIGTVPVPQGILRKSPYEEFNRMMFGDKNKRQNFKFTNRTRRYPWLPNSLREYRTEHLTNNLVLSKQPIIGANTPLAVKQSSSNFKIGL